MIVVFGSLNADLIFAMPELPAPGQTTLARSLRIEPGGKGANQALAAARDGAEVAMVGAVGSDHLGELVLANLREAKADVSRVIRIEDATGCAVILTDGEGRNMITVASGANGAARALQADDALLARKPIVLVQMEGLADEVAAFLAQASGHGCRAILNLAPAIWLDEAVLRRCALLVVNEIEAAEVASWVGTAATAAGLRRGLGIDVLRTMGAGGSEASTAAEGEIRVPAPRLRAVDTSAAGDCFIGFLASALDGGATLRAAMIRATDAAALACMRLGSQSSIPWGQEVDAAAARREHNTSS
jgi:ribokinase